MAFDTLFKKYFALVVLGLVALVAYFQASGTTALLGASLAEPLTPTEPASIASKLALPSSERRTAEPLIKRNPFDSVTGPLDAKPPPALAAPDPEPRITDPLRSPVCTDIKVQIVTESDDPHWSFAALQGNGDAMPQLRRVGDSVGNREVAYIGFNPTEASPAVWLTSGSELCQALLFAKQPEVSAAPAAAAAPAQGEPVAEAPPPKGAKPVPDDIKSKIQKISDNEFHVDRGVVDRILADQAELMRSARIVPEKKDGKVVGIRLFGIRPDTLLGTLGLQNGDRLETINGFDMASPEKALEAYARLRTAGNLNVRVNRRGQSQSIDYRIK